MVNIDVTDGFVQRICLLTATRSQSMLRFSAVWLQDWFLHPDLGVLLHLLHGQSWGRCFLVHGEGCLAPQREAYLDRDDGDGTNMELEH